MYALVACRDNASALRGGAAFPVRDDATCALDDRDQRNDVMRLQAGIDNEIGEACRDHAIGVAIAAIAREASVLLDFRELLTLFIGHQERARREDRSIGEFCAGTRA